MWSDELQKQTKEHFKKMPGAAMKHFGDSRFGICVLMEGKFIISEYETNIEHKFESIEAVIEAGWAID